MRKRTPLPQVGGTAAPRAKPVEPNHAGAEDTSAPKAGVSLERVATSDPADRHTYAFRVGLQGGRAEDNAMCLMVHRQAWSAPKLEEMRVAAEEFINQSRIPKRRRKLVDQSEGPHAERAAIHDPNATNGNMFRDDVRAFEAFLADRYGFVLLVVREPETSTFEPTVPNEAVPSVFVPPAEEKESSGT